MTEPRDEVRQAPAPDVDGGAKEHGASNEPKVQLLKATEPGSGKSSDTDTSHEEAPPAASVPHSEESPAVASQTYKPLGGLAQCPTEIIVHILGYIQNLSALFAMTQVCHSIRAAALKTPSLWQVLELSQGAGTARCAALLSLCDERSGSTIHYADLMAIKAAEPLTNSLDLLQRSKDTLKGLSLSEYALCRCGKCRRGYAFDEGHKDAQSNTFQGGLIHAHTDESIDSAGQEVAVSLFELLRKATGLEYLCMRFSFSHGLKFLKSPLRLGTPMAHPKELVLLGPVACCQHRGPLGPREVQIIDFFGQLASKVTRLVLDDDGLFQPDFEWARMAWIAFLRRAEYLENVRIPIARCVHYKIFPLLKLASLYPFTAMPQGTTELAFSEIPNEDEEGQGSAHWFSMPALTTMHSTPSIAQSIKCPGVKVAHLHIDSKDEVALLPHALHAWNDLETLTISLDLQGTPQWLGTSLLKDVLDVLTPYTFIVRKAPYLRHLGIRCTLASRGLGFALQDPHWAVKPCNKRETDVVDRHFGRDGTMPALSAQILPMEEQRRGPPNLFGPKGFPLETIKLAGINVDPELWGKIGKAVQAKVTCYPEPLTEVKVKR